MDLPKFTPRLKKAWTTHQGVLVRVLYACQGDVIELGGGPFSTPILHWVCKDLGKKLITYDDTPEYYEFEKQFISNGHSVRLVKSWDEVPVHKYGLVFIDHHPSLRRGTDVIRFKDHAEYLVLHDTEAEESNGYGPIWEHFKYRYDWKQCKPWVSVISNFKDPNLLWTSQS